MAREHPNTMQSRKHFDLLAAQYDALFVPRLASYEAMHNAILSMLPTSHTGALRVLELGPGTGNLTRKVLERLPNSRVVGYELSAEMLAQAREKLTAMIDRVHLIEADLSQATFDGPFDVVLSAIAVHHVPPRAKAALFRRLYSALQPGGVLIIGDTFRAATPALDATYRQLRAVAPPDSTPQTAAYEAYRQQAGPAGGSSTHLSHYLRWLGQAGFQSVDCVWKHFSLAVVYGERPLAA
jgi:tRNA (cmo5U34)-methyltransferase